MTPDTFVLPELVDGWFRLIEAAGHGRHSVWRLRADAFTSGSAQLVYRST
jgi:hypothetical protein